MDDVDLKNLIEVDTLTQMFGAEVMTGVRVALIAAFAVGAFMSHTKIVRFMLFAAIAYIVFDIFNML